MPNLGKTYKWSGSNITCSLGGPGTEWDYIIKGTGDTMIVSGSGTTFPSTLILSDDLSRYKKCGVLLTSEIKVGTAVTTVISDLDVHCAGFVDDAQLAAGHYIALGSGEQQISTWSGAAWVGGQSQPSENFIKNLELTTPRTYGHCFVHFAGGPDGSIWPFKYVGFQMALKWTDASSNEYQIKTAQWVYE